MGKNRGTTKKKGARVPQPQERESVALQPGVIDTMQGPQANHSADYQPPLVHAAEAQTSNVPRDPRPVLVDGSSTYFQALMNQGYHINWHVALTNYRGPMSHTAPMDYITATMDNMAIGYGVPTRNNPAVGYALLALSDGSSVDGFQTQNGAPSNAGFATFGGLDFMYSPQTWSRLPAIYALYTIGPAFETDEAPGLLAAYEGDIHNSGEIPPEQSTSLMIKNLPPGCTETTLLDQLCLHGPFGKVYKAHVVPGGPGYAYPTSLGKISVWTRQDAELLFNFIHWKNLVIDSYIAMVKWDPKLTAEARD